MKEIAKSRESIVISKQLSARPFVSLAQAAKIAEKDKNRVKNKGNLLPQRHLAAEGAEVLGC